ncbi:hypothetical protein NS376_05630 [Pseudomonas oryzihabitans]|nr:hypothetical protein NS376_05630 [Pseudomonas psychrotolerans]
MFKARIQRLRGKYGLARCSNGGNRRGYEILAFRNFNGSFSYRSRMQPALHRWPVEPEQGYGHQQPSEQQGITPSLAAAIVAGNGIEFGYERASVVLRGLAVAVFAGHGGLLAGPGREIVPATSL